MQESRFILASQASHAFNVADLPVRMLLKFSAELDATQALDPGPLYFPL